MICNVLESSGERFSLKIVLPSPLTIVNAKFARFHTINKATIFPSPIKNQQKKRI